MERYSFPSVSSNSSGSGIDKLPKIINSKNQTKMKKILFILFAVLMTALASSCNNRKIACDDLTFIQQDDTTIMVYQDGKLFNGIAYIDGAKGTQVLVDSGKFFSITKSKGRRIIADIYPNHSCFYDQDGNIISKEIFDKLYPDVVLYDYNYVKGLCK